MVFSVLIAALLAGPALAAPAPADFHARCQAGQRRHPLRSPAEMLAERGIRLADACPFQSKIDKAHECQDAATVLQNMYEILLEERLKTCNLASAAVTEAARQCHSQQSCLEAQAKAVKVFEKALSDEVELVRAYREQVTETARYTIEAIAGGGTQLVRWVQIDSKKADDGSNKYSDRGRGGAAEFLLAQNNRDAQERVLRGENPENAEAVVDRFKRNQAKASDLTGIRSDLLLEPLRLAQASRDWNRELATYEQDLNGNRTSLISASTEMAESAKRLEGPKRPPPADIQNSTVTGPTNKATLSTNHEPPELQPNSEPPPSGSPVAAAAPAPNNSIGAGLDSMLGVVKAAAVVAPLLAPQQGAAGSTAAGPATVQAGHEPLRPFFSQAKTPATSLLETPEGAAKKSAQPKDKQEGGSSIGSLVKSEVSGGSSLRESLRRKLTGASTPHPRGAPSQAMPGGGSAPEAQSGGSHAAQGTAEYPLPTEAGADGFATAGGLPLQGMSPMAAGGGASPEAMVLRGLATKEDQEQVQPAIPPAESSSLFQRARETHLRALRRGLVLRGLRDKL